MSKKDYEAVAKLIRKECAIAALIDTTDAHKHALRRITEDLASYFESQDSSFDCNRFFKAAGY